MNDKKTKSRNAENKNRCSWQEAIRRKCHVAAFICITEILLQADKLKLKNRCHAGVDWPKFQYIFMTKNKHQQKLASLVHKAIAILFDDMTRQIPFVR